MQYETAKKDSPNPVTSTVDVQAEEVTKMRSKVKKEPVHSHHHHQHIPSSHHSMMATHPKDVSVAQAMEVMDDDGHDGSGDPMKDEPGDFIETHCHWKDCDKDFVTQDDLVKHINNDHIHANKKSFVCRSVGW